jgi:vesicle-associated membrane protein 7
MAIIYSVVARGSVVLAEHTDSQGNFITVTHRILEKIPHDKDDMRSYLYDEYVPSPSIITPLTPCRYIFHYLVASGITYLCMADESFGRRIPYAFLDNIKSRFLSTYGDHANTAVAYGMNADFQRVLKIQMVWRNQYPSLSPLLSPSPL